MKKYSLDPLDVADVLSWVALISSWGILLPLSIAAFVMALTSCGKPESSVFDVWYQQVINEPYDPLNGSKY